MSAETVLTRVPTLRAAAPFAAPEQAPSAALLAQPWTLVAGGQRLVVRPARAQDLPALAGLLVRCSPTTRLGWSGRGGTVLPLVQQEAWLREPGAVIVESSPGRAVAVGALRPATCTGEDDPIAGAVEVLVHDAWQRRGIGSALVAHFAGALLVQGRTELQVNPDADPVAAQALLSGLGARVRGQRHAHGRCPRVHVPRTALDMLGPLRELSYR
ncbi:Ribosomal protein S18 acetylase RimI [Quadrisphaera granulorum]|uniref:Ribosomal protein S18 acetylase RimI-like enzyme n=1 Tax=Quadrisphaera granulorum TaxID=317664 RepID=A0A316AE14_9ACTN|nr:GNAT family N-acetyltransferase [Quadrisphaera granulorum]PWJ55852.1 ribosomal protein S18 acetylase RimI-like enzyme [Quadrisphaera granulorum]SZE95349.1 Ribosomal protein S18 acetylase RimI [Quadrisphaera granulorum]